jgi:uracil-DNA glycosylase family 4
MSALFVSSRESARPIVAADAPGMPPPGPDFLAEVERTSEEVEPNFEAEARLLAGRAQAGETIPGYDEAWHANIRAKAKSKRDPELKRTAKRLKEEHLAERWKQTAATLTEFYRSSIYDMGVRLPVKVGTKKVTAHFVPGHILGDPKVLGPRPARVMVVSKHPGFDEVKSYRHLDGKAAEPWHRALKELSHHDESREWYATTLIKHQPLRPGSDRIDAAWVANCLPLLFAELMLVRPDFVLSLGADAAKAILGEKKLTVSDARDRVYEFRLPATEAGPEKTVKLMVIPHPASVFHNPPGYGDFVEALHGFVRVVKGGTPSRERISTRRHVFLYSERQLARVVDELLERPDSDVIALDCEWHGEWYEQDSYLRTIQFSVRAGEAFVVVLRSEGGKEAFHPNLDAALPHLRRLCKSTPDRKVRAGGHSFRADLPWLIRYGLDLRDEFDAPATAEETKHHGGWDTADMLHALYESEKSFGLKIWVTKLLGVPDYSKPLDDYVAEQMRGKKKRDLGGFGMIPDKILLPYAALDADFTRELFDVLNGVGEAPGLLDCDRMGISSRKAFWLSQGAAPAFLDMEMAGIPIDRDRVDRLTFAFLGAQAERLAKLREMTRWPTFNPNSPEQVTELMFGEQYHGKKDPKTGESLRLRPEGAMCLGLTPIKSTSDKEWARIDDDELDMYNPSTDKEVLGMLSQEHEVIQYLLDTKIIGQVLKFPLHPPRRESGTGQIVKEGGYFQYDGGLPTLLSSDDKLYTVFRNLETGRVSTRPSCQNFSKKREGDYKRLLGDNYPCALRAVIKPPPGCVLIEADYRSAEVAALAWLANDEKMIEDARRSLLDEKDPEYVNIHAKTAVEWFKLDCEPNKKAIEAIGKEGLYVGAKNVRFGIPYGRGARAIWRQCLQEGTDIDLETVQMLLQQYSINHAAAMAMLKTAGDRVLEPGYLIGVHGRPRRFGFSSDRSIIASMQREAFNAPIQNAVGDTMRLAMRKLYEFKRAHAGPETFDFLLNIHDALLFAVPIPYIDWFIGERGILEEYMCRQVPFYPTDFEGNRREGLGPYYFSVESEVYLNWGEKVTPEQGDALGIPLKYCHGKSKAGSGKQAA